MVGGIKWVIFAPKIIQHSGDFSPINGMIEAEQGDFPISLMGSDGIEEFSVAFHIFMQYMHPI
jgi:hypothetical protein